MTPVTNTILTRNTNEKNRKLQKDHADFDRGEETETRPERKLRQWESINTSKNVFDSVMDKGINSEESIFDKYAVFRTDGGLTK